MMLRSLFFIALMMASMMPPRVHHVTLGVTVVHAQENLSYECLQAVYETLAHEQRVYRAALLGHKPARTLAVGSIRYDKNFDAWTKTSEGWVRAGSDPDNPQTIDDADMDDRSDISIRRGIFELTEAETTDLIPQLTQALRAFSCRLQSRCGAAVRSLTAAEGEDTVTVHPDGCIEFELDVLEACRLPGDGETEGRGNVGPVNMCTEAARTVLEREEEFLPMLVTYDAAYRSLLQVGGIFEYLMADLESPLFTTLWQTARALKELDDIPCFTSQCDEQ